jgi:predicted nucleotidyltransferase
LKLEEFRAKLTALKPFLVEKYRVKTIGLFGSYVRSEQKQKSDLDVLVEFSEPISLFRFVELEDFLSGELGVKVDLVAKDSLKARIKDNILSETVYI